MKTKIIRIRNSRGVRIPKPLLQEAGFEDQVVLRVIEDGIVIEAAGEPRVGWAEAAQTLHEREGDGLLGGVVSTEFDEAEWVWE